MIAEQTKSALERLIDGGDAISPEAARIFLQMQFSDEDNRRMDYLAERARQGLLTEKEAEEFREFCFTIEFLSILHLRARNVLDGVKQLGA